MLNILSLLLLAVISSVIEGFSIQSLVKIKRLQVRAFDGTEESLIEWDAKLRNRLKPQGEKSATLSERADPKGTLKWLKEKAWTPGLINTVYDSKAQYFKKYFVLDNSGSMQANDGHILGSGLMPFTQRLIKCSRFQELLESVKFHTKLGDCIQVDSEFRFLNDHEPFSVGNDETTKTTPGKSLLAATGISSKASADGGTPLCKQINAIEKAVRASLNTIRNNNQKVSVTIITDGEPSDGDLRRALQGLKGLPVWIVIKLCTDEPSVVKYWNEIESDLEEDLDVLDDLKSEAKEVYQFNDWLTYGEPLHRLRESGTKLKHFDILDEKRLSSDQMVAVVAGIYGVSTSDLPNIYEDWSEFMRTVSQLSDKEEKVWCPVAEKKKAWIDVEKLQAYYKP